MKGKRGRPPVPFSEAVTFLELVERERQAGCKVEAAFLAVRRRDPLRWGSFPKMWRLWRRTAVLR